MTFDAWWELVRWGAVPAIGLLMWWVRDIQSRHRHTVERLHEKLDAETKARHDAVKALHDDLNAWKLDAASRFASSASMERGFEKLENAIQGLGTRLERWIESGSRQTGSD